MHPYTTKYDVIVNIWNTDRNDGGFGQLHTITVPMNDERGAISRADFMTKKMKELAKEGKCRFEVQIMETTKYVYAKGESQ